MKCLRLIGRLFALIAIVGVMAALAVQADGADKYKGKYCEGEGDVGYLRLIDESLSYFHPTPEFPNISMLYRADWDALSEGPAWGMWWIQNSYGPTYCVLPFIQEPWLTALQHSQDFWYDHQADGKTTGMHAIVTPPAGSLCDCAGKDGVIYVQGDCNWKIHDWGYGFTCAGVIMEAELLLISRDKAAIAKYLPKMELACDFVEDRRDPKNGLFLVGPAANLLAPSYGGVKQADGTFGKGYLSETSVTYLAALNRMIELFKLTGDSAKQTEYESRRDVTIKSLPQLITPEGYFVKFIEPDGTKHGVYGQDKFGYFETSVNVDAVCHRAIDDAIANKIYEKIASLPQLRPHKYLITNYPSLDDSYADWGNPNVGGIMQYGTWVNGGAWSTLEARTIMAYYRLGKYEDVRQSALKSREFAEDYQLDAPLKEFGKTPWFDDKPTNICYDAFGIPAATVRGLFEYLYKADRLVLYPHIPPAIKSYKQLEPVRFGEKQVFLSVKNGGPKILSVRVNGKPVNLESSDCVDLLYNSLPDKADVEIAMSGGWPKEAVQAKSDIASVDLSRVRSVSELPNKLKPQYQALCAMKDKLGTVNCSDYERAFLSEAMRAFEVCKERMDIQYSGVYPELTRKKQIAILKMYEDSALAMYNGFDGLMKRYAASNDLSQKELANAWGQVNR